MRKTTQNMKMPVTTTSTLQYTLYRSAPSPKRKNPWAQERRRASPKPPNSQIQTNQPPQPSTTSAPDSAKPDSRNSTSLINQKTAPQRRKNRLNTPPPSNHPNAPSRANALSSTFRSSRKPAIRASTPLSSARAGVPPTTRKLRERRTPF